LRSSGFAADYTPAPDGVPKRSITVVVSGLRGDALAFVFFFKVDIDNFIYLLMMSLILLFGLYGVTFNS
jgi:hypothetical protein